MVRGVTLLVACCMSASALTIVSRRTAAFSVAAGITAPWHPTSCRAADSIVAADCEDCTVRVGTLPVSGTQQYQTGDVINLDDGAAASVVRRPGLFDTKVEGVPTDLGIPNPQLEAKKALYKLAAGDYDVASVRGKLSSLIQTTPVVVFSLST
jgi:hypothetical protein